MKGLVGALGFMTILPLGKGKAWQGAAMVSWFPAVGLVLGGFWAGFDWLAGLVFPPAVRAGLDVLFLVLVTGGLHLDGLADTADGLLSHRGREEALRIMKDSRIGTWGVLALLAVLGLKAISLAEPLAGPRFAILLLVPAYGRLAMLVTMRLLPYGRGEEGIAHDLMGRGGRFHWYWWAAILVLASLLAGWPGVLLINAAFWATLFALLVFYSSRMGCVTGDMVGAAGEIAETAMLLSLTVRW